jgi:long-subunit fatty acid transport protein
LGFKAWAGGFSILDIGTRKTGMGAVVGRPDDLSAIYHNPAGLTLSRGTNLYLSSGVMFPQSDFQLRPWAGSERYIEDEVDGAGYYPTTSLTTAYGVIPMLTASTDLGRDDLVVALGIYVPNAIGGSFEAASPARFHMIESYVVGGYLTAAIAYRLHETFSLGAAASLVYVRTAGQRKFFPVIEGLDLGPLLGGDSTLSIDGDDWKVRGTLGMLWTPHPRLSVGAAVLTRVDVALEGDITLRSGGDAAREFELQGTHVTELLFPWIFQLGANVDVLRWLEVGFEVRYFLYSQFEEQRTRVEGIDIIDELVVPKNYRNSIQGSGGVRATLPVLPLPLEVMLGLHYDRTPAPVTNVSIEQPSFHHVGLHSGLRLQAAAWLRLALTYAHFWYLERATDESVHRSPPSNYRASASGDMLTLVTEVGF